MMIDLVNKLTAKIQKTYKNKIRVSYGEGSFILSVENDKAKQVYYPQQYRNELNEPALTQRIIESLDKDTVFYDVGANVGYYTALTAEISSDGEIYSFELDKSFIQAIKETSSYYDTNIHIENVALGEKVGETIQFSECDGTYKTEPEVLPGDGNGDTEDSIISTTLDAYTQNHHDPDIVKIDVDGFEYKIFQGAKRIFSEGDITVFVEIHGGPNGLKKYGDSVEEIISFIREKSKNYRMIQDQDERYSDTIESPDPSDIGHNSILECHF